MSRSVCILVLGFLSLVVGCGGGDSIVVPVSGVVTFNDEPLEGATVTFLPMNTKAMEAPSSFAKTDEDGRFELQTAAGESGAMTGKHKVKITKTTGDEDEEDDSVLEFEHLLPVKYNQETELTFDVPKEGTDEANFDLKAEPGWEKADQARRRESQGSYDNGCG